MRSRFFIALAVVLTSSLCSAQNVNNPGNYRFAGKEIKTEDGSHSHFGKAFNVGPRQRPRLLKGVGNVDFPITTKSPQAQAFFNQGVNLSYSFMWTEAERAFRMAAVIDPDCAMAYWGLATCDAMRGKDFIEIAKQKSKGITEREKMYIDALEIVYGTGNRNEKISQNIDALEKLVLAYPDDLEAKAILAWVMVDAQDNATFRPAIDALFNEVLDKNPMHPGAHHYRIHMWDNYGRPEMAVDSANAYSKAAPGVGHALHMPGHIYSQLGTWSKAADAMDKATRAEKKWFAEERMLPHESWNYGHNQEFLIANMGYMGRINEGIKLSQELIDTPRDPNGNSGTGFSSGGMGRHSMLRCFVRGERWAELEKALSDESDRITTTGLWNRYAKVLVATQKKDIEGAKSAIKEQEDVNAKGSTTQAALLEMKGRLALLEGRNEDAIDALKEAADIEDPDLLGGDPNTYPKPIYETLAWAYLQAGNPLEASRVLSRMLKKESENGFAWALQVEALVAQDRMTEAHDAYDKLSEVWKNADSDLPALQRVQKVWKEKVRNGSFTPVPMPSTLRSYGPDSWQPFTAPGFELQGPGGKSYRLQDYKGKNVVLLFYLGGSCDHCLSQLEAFSKEKDDIEKLDTVILSSSRDTVEVTREKFANNPKFTVPMLFDKDLRAAKAYKAFDEFENLELHGAVLIDKKGRLWWFNVASEPFLNVKFLKDEITRLNKIQARPDAP